MISSVGESLKLESLVVLQQYLVNILGIEGKGPKIGGEMMVCPKNGGDSNYWAAHSMTLLSSTDRCNSLRLEEVGSREKGLF